MNPLYILDSDVFMQAKNMYYRIEFCPAFWDWLVERNKSGKFASIDKVKEELKNGNQQFLDWVNANHQFFRPIDTQKNQLESHLSKITDHVEQLDKPQEEKNRFLRAYRAADFWLIGYSMTKNCVVVTQEKPAPIGRKIKIPDICSHFGLNCMDIFQLLRKDGARFVLEK